MDIPTPGTAPPPSIVVIEKATARLAVAIQRAILHRLAHVLRLDSCRVGEISDGTRDLQDAMVGPGREVEARDGRLDERIGGLGHSTIGRHESAYFATAATMIATLTRAMSENRLDEKLKTYTVPRLLIVDEIGYLPIDQLGANLVFQLISRRYERGPLILTSNQSFANWGDVFGDRVIATAILDRVLHHGITISIRGYSYRLKEKIKAGLFKTIEATT